MDPSTTTRERWTEALVSQQTPTAWPQPLQNRFNLLKSLLDKLGHHQAMTSNNQQAFMTPANSKNRVYFMWDFIGRTLGYFPNLTGVTSLDGMNAAQKKLWGEVQSRSSMASQLILDTNPGMLNMMVESTYPSSAGDHPDFGDAIKEDARRLAA